MLEFPKIEDLSKTEKADTELPEEIDASLENKEKIIEKKERLPHTIKGNFETNPDGSINIETEYGILKGIQKDCLPDDLKKKKNGEFKIAFTDQETIAKEILNQLLETPNKNE